MNVFCSALMSFRLSTAPSVTHVTPCEQLSPLLHETAEVVQIGCVHPPCISDGIGDLIAVDVPVPEMSVDEVETGTTLPRKRVRQRNAELPEILEDMPCSDDPLAGFSLSPVSEQVIEEPSLQERFRECTVSQVVGQQHFAEQNIDNSVDMVPSPMRSVAANVD